MCGDQNWILARDFKFSVGSTNRMVMSNGDTPSIHDSSLVGIWDDIRKGSIISLITHMCLIEDPIATVLSDKQLDVGAITRSFADFIWRC